VWVSLAIAAPFFSHDASRSLYLQDNSLTGSLPPAITTLTQLMYVHVGGSVLSEYLT
jgi:hypothetical protein